MKRGRPDARAESRDSTVGPEKDQLPLAAEHRVDPDPPAEISQVCAAGHADMLAIVDEFAGRGVIERAGASAQPGPALDDRDPQAAIDQGRGRRQARQAAADDHDMRGRGFWQISYHASNALDRRFAEPITRSNLRPSSPELRGNRSSYA